MKINLDEVLVNFNKKEIVTEEGPLTVGRVIATALATPLEDDKNIEPTRVLARKRLAERAYAGGEMEIEAKDVAEIQQRIARTHILVVAGRVIEVLNG